MNELHSLLKRQLRRFPDETKPLIDGQSGFLGAINDAYWQFDADRKLLEHSLELTSQELLERNAELRRVNSELEMRVARRTAELTASEAHFRGLFEHAPISLWEEDYSAVQKYVDDLRRAGVTNFSAYFEAHPEAVAECTARVKIVDVNRATLEMYHAQNKAQLLADLSKVFGSESLASFKEELIALAGGELSFESETTNYTLGGERRDIFLRLTVAPGYEETWAKIFVGISDITERRQAEARLEQSEALFRALFDLSPDAVIVIDPHDLHVSWPIIDCNMEACLMNGYDREELIGHSVDILNLTRGTEEERRDYLEQLHKLGLLKLETHHRHKSGLIFPVEVSTTLIHIGARELVIGIDRDITERKRAEDALRAAETKYRTLVENMPAVVYVDQAHEPHNTIYINSRVEEMLGYSPEDWIAKPNFCDDIIHPGDLERMWRQAEEAQARGRFAGDYRYIAKDGRIVWVHDEASFMKNEADESYVWQGVMLDITAQKEAEEALRRSEERFKLMAWATTDAVWDWDLQTNQIWWGEGLQKIFHYPPEMIRADPAWRLDHIHPEDRAKVNRAVNNALEGGMKFWSKEYRFQRVDGSYADIMDRGYVIRDDGDQPYRMVGSMMDITERKQSEETIRRQNEMLSELHQITLDLLKYREIGPLLNALVGLAAKFLDASYVETLLLEGEGLVMKAATHNPHQLIGERVDSRDAVLAWQVFETRQPAVLSDYAHWDQRQNSYEGLQLHAVANFPILNDDQCLGVLGLGREKPNYEFTHDEIQSGLLFASLTALVLNNAQLREALREQSIRDPLTGLYNRRYMEEALRQQLHRVTRQLHPLGIIMIDIDFFKRFNDNHGHAVGDALLRELGRFLQSHIRVEDIACRYGGEEFLLIMPDAALEVVQVRAEYLRQAVRRLRVRAADQSQQGITLSLGVAIYPQHGRNIEAVLRAADSALYRAKQEGRDRVVVAEYEG